MRICMVGNGWSPASSGGLNRFFRGLHDGLVELGHDPAAVVTGPRGDAPPEVRVAGHGGEGAASRLLAMSREVRAAADRADVLNVHFSMYAAGPLMLPAVRSLPVVVTFQGPWAWESEVQGANAASVRTKKAIENFVYRRASRVCVLSRAFADIAVDYGIPRDIIHVVRPGVELDRFVEVEPAERMTLRDRAGILPEHFVVVAVRRLVPRMGLDRLLRAWSNLPAGHRQNGRLLIVGDGSERASLEKLSSDLGVSDTVTFPGRVADADLPGYYAMADLAVVPSVALEGFGLVLLEALATGTPVLASDVGGMAEALAGLPKAHLVAGDGVDEWTDRLSDVMDGNGGLASRSECRAYAETFSWSATAATMTDIYTQAIAASAA